MNTKFLNTVLSAKDERKTRLSSALDRIKAKKEAKKKAEEEESKSKFNSWRKGIIDKAKELDYAKQIFKNFRFTVEDINIEDEDDDFIAAYLPIRTENPEVGIDVFINVDENKGLSIGVSLYDFDTFKDFELDFPLGDDDVIFKELFGFDSGELYQRDDYDKIIKAIDKVSNRAVAKAVEKRIDQFLEDNYDKIEKIIRG